MLDEALSALSLKLCQAMRDELRSLQRQTAIANVFVTHAHEEARDLSDRICVSGHGEIQHPGTPNDIYENREYRFVADFIGETNFSAVDVLHVAGNQAIVRSDVGFEFTIFQKGAAASTRAALSLRPEKIGPEDQAGGQMMTGRITNKNYKGGYAQ